jgi:UMF1 family MFS transporter
MAGSTRKTSGESTRVTSSNDPPARVANDDTEFVDAAAGELSGTPASMAAAEAAATATWLSSPHSRSVTGGPIASRLGQISWATYEGARNPYVLLVTIYLFAPYFTRFVVGDPVRGQEIWAAISSWGAFATALAAPFLGAIADIGGRRKPWIAAYTAIMVVAMLLLWRATPNSTGLQILMIGALVVTANFAFEFSNVFLSAMLPTIAPPNRIGPLSGLGLALGNAAGIVLMIFMLVAFALPGRVHWPFIPSHPLFGIDQAAHEPDRLAGPISGLWLLVLCMPLFLFTPDKPSTGLPVITAMRNGVNAVIGTIKSLRHYRNVAHYLMARMIFNDGMSAVLLFGGIYASGTFHWGNLQMLVYGLELSVFAVVGGFFGGWLDNRFGSKRAIFVSIGGTALFFAASLTMAPDRILWFIPYDVRLPHVWSLPFFNTWPEIIFLMIVNGVAICITAGYANARTMLARIAPPEKMTEFFGFMSLSGSSTTFLANVAVTTMTWLTQSQRGGIVIILAFLLVGLVWMSFVKEERAVAIQ